ncbi:uncharacterized protein BT62DRAFT_981465 [Guyanagaster necrorhizus]|uniref:MYND-type domain-containing protein n=1 Tax=Guyanagaster necrorhizus TaxID=856835 RepID=A0A9P8AR33_9AGAR|nr:uncharacterized protein BT62DRAFT_981465 [Guyanagaster necrorhizus MCA 3950]KAG7444635.1 hypothetical protein BT62DRAFT_981465 [Guyanagaster necrorhizus MCA 3950]
MDYLDPNTRARIMDIIQSRDTGEGRSIEELTKTQEMLKGQESERLRTFCTTQSMVPGRDLDAYGMLLATADLIKIREDFDMRTPGEAARAAAADELYQMRWGPTRVPIYNLLGLCTLLYPPERTSYLSIAKYLISTARVPVDGTDLSGTRALSHCFSTKPGFDLEYAQILYDAGGDVNSRNRYGSTVAQEIVQVYEPGDRDAVNRAHAALEWFFLHGGNIDLADGDGFTVRVTIDRTLRKIPMLKGITKLMNAEDARRQALGDTCCALCARTGESTTLARCGKCKKVRYCVPGLRACQTLDWPKHKKTCKKF